MVVNEADRLHEGVTEGRADETEAAFFEFFAHALADGQRFFGIRRLLRDERPDVSIEAAEHFLRCQKRFRIFDDNVFSSP